MTKGSGVIAVAAGLMGFATGVASLVVQFAQVSRDPEMITTAPRQVLFTLHRNPGSQVEMVRIAATLSHINRTSIGKTAILVEEAAFLEVDGREYPYLWQSFENFQAIDGELRSNESRSALPVAVAPGDVVSHETYFAPNTAPRFKDWNAFLARLRSFPEVRIRFRAEFYGEISSEAECVVQFSDARLKGLETRKWDAPACR